MRRYSIRSRLNHGTISTAVLAFGILGDQARAEADAEHAVAIVHTDCVAQVGRLTLLAQRMRTAGRGRIVVSSSIAGVRVRRANYVYGSAKQDWTDTPVKITAMSAAWEVCAAIDVDKCAVGGCGLPHARGSWRRSRPIVRSRRR